MGSETWVEKNFFWVNPPKKTHPKFNTVSFLVLLITKDSIMLKALEKL